MIFMELTPVARTLLIPLAFRAAETQRPDAILHDEQAVALAAGWTPVFCQRSTSKTWISCAP